MKSVLEEVATGMAGEFFVMERLFRLGHQPALTMGNAMAIDILVQGKSRTLYEVSVKAVCGGGKWGASKTNEASAETRIYVLLEYTKFEDPKTTPKVYFIPAPKVQRMKHRWHEGKGFYYSSTKHGITSPKP